MVLDCALLVAELRGAFERDAALVVASLAALAGYPFDMTKNYRMLQ